MVFSIIFIFLLSDSVNNVDQVISRLLDGSVQYTSLSDEDQAKETKAIEDKKKSIIQKVFCCFNAVVAVVVAVVASVVIVIVMDVVVVVFAVIVVECCGGRCGCCGSGCGLVLWCCLLYTSPSPRDRG